MSYTLLSERKIAAARKQHRCIWCGQAIQVGQPYTYERSVYEGQMQSHHWHDECAQACTNEVREWGGDFEFVPYENPRPPAVHASDCAVHNGPALPVGPCTCGAVPPPAPAPVIHTTVVEVPLSEGPKPYCKCVLNEQRWLPEECPIHRPTHQPSASQSKDTL